MRIAEKCLRLIEDQVPAVWLVIAQAKGSVPRESGAAMLVTLTTTQGTIGGGHLELKAIVHARVMLVSNAQTPTQRHFPLGPALGQCCGGAVSVLLVPVLASMKAELLSLAQIEATSGRFALTRVLDTGERVSVELTFSPWQVCVFGAGHVGKAIVEVMSALPCAITWIDAREAEFTQTVPDNVTVVAVDAPADAVADIAPDAQVLVLTHSHALDLAICFELLKRNDLAYCGLIGSATKAATFHRRFLQRGVSAVDASRIICPIGHRSLRSKHPGMIAVGVAMDLALRQQEYEPQEREQLF